MSLPSVLTSKPQGFISSDNKSLEMMSELVAPSFRKRSLPPLARENAVQVLGASVDLDMFSNILVENPDITYDKETLLSSLAGCVRAQNVCAVLIMIFTILPICKILPFTNAGPAHLRLLGLENSRIMSLHESLSAAAN